MTVTKILEQTLSAGSTLVSFTDADIPNSLIRVYSNNSDIIPVSRTLTNNTLTVTYEPQLSDLGVAVEIVKAGLDIVDNVNSTDADKALSAKQGNLLNIALEDVADNLDALTNTVNNLDIPDNITDLNDVTVNNIQTGQVLVWDGSKFVNQSGGSSQDYSTTETIVGTWIDGKPLYQKTFYIENPTNGGYVMHGINNIGVGIVYNVTANRNGDAWMCSTNYNGPNDWFSCMFARTGEIYTLWAPAITIKKVYATFRYTKTTD